MTAKIKMTREEFEDRKAEYCELSRMLRAGEYYPGDEREIRSRMQQLLEEVGQG